MKKIVNNENSGKEGFEHKGNSFIAGKKNKNDNSDKSEQSDSQFVLTIKTFYRIAADIAIILIKMPYKFLSQGLTLIIQLINNINETLKPMFAFINQMLKIVQRVAKQFYNIFMKIFKQVFNILRNLPDFIKKYATIAINFINQMVNQVIDMLTSFFDLFQNVLDRILEIPQKFFSIMSQMTTVFFNMFNMMMDIPEKGLDMAIGFQDTLIGMMDRPLKIPFADQFLG
jgi:phage-related protein